MAELGSEHAKGESTLTEDEELELAKSCCRYAKFGFPLDYAMVRVRTPTTLCRRARENPAWLSLTGFTTPGDIPAC